MGRNQFHGGAGGIRKCGAIVILYTVELSTTGIRENYFIAAVAQ